KFNLDIAFIPIGGTYTMDSEDALTAAMALAPDLCIPIHFNTFEAVKADSKAFCTSLIQKGIDCRILESGSGITL
ncbi:MAG: MBL fold metallo-hydrolase, partial [Clostridia bacterium]|nr:MBL fold metallo-hydrolase [Clostridia bacterium]